jgi:peptide/nickel transport system substrate-binding protein
MARKLGYGRAMLATLGVGLLSALLASPGWGQGVTPVETPMFLEQVASGKLPPVARRIPAEPSIVQLTGADQSVGVPGGELRMLMGSTKDVRQMVVYGYTRLVGYDRNFNIVPDVLEKVDVQDGRVFTFHLRKGHKWSDGKPFTSEDFRYYWEDMATNKEMNPGGPPMELLLDGEMPKFEVIDETTLRYSWSRPNPFFLPMQAQPAPIYLYRPAHFLKKFHAKHQDPDKLKELVTKAKRRNWVELHFREDHQFRNDNPDMPSLEPWVLVTEPPADRFVFVRNPYFHRMDVAGHQLPYADRVIMTITNPRLISAKAGAGEADLQARGIQFSNYTFLKKGEKRNDFSVRRWDSARGAHMALYPNLNTTDEGWRELFRKAEFRRALSLAIDRHEINQVLLFGLATEGNNTVLKESPLHRPEYTSKWANFDIAEANKLLDGLGLTKRDSNGLRLLPDGRPMEIVVETAGEDNEQVDVLGLIHDSWLKVGIKLFPKALQREVFRKRIFAGTTLMSIWYGLENGIPTAQSSPGELVPTSEYQLQWPAWGLYYDTKGRAGEAPDLPAAKRLLTLFNQWRDTQDVSEKTKAWHEILDIHADQVFSLGLISHVPQPVVVNNRLRNVPVNGIYNWDPGAHFGIYRPDTFWYAPRERS